MLLFRQVAETPSLGCTTKAPGERRGSLNKASRRGYDPRRPSAGAVACRTDVTGRLLRDVPGEEPRAGDGPEGWRGHLGKVKRVSELSEDAFKDSEADREGGTGLP